MKQKKRKVSKANQEQQAQPENSTFNERKVKGIYNKAKSCFKREAKSLKLRL